MRSGQGRKTVRLKGYDYRNPNWYYITICTYDKKSFLGKVKDGKVILSGIGKVAIHHWKKIPEHFEYVKLDYFIITPNHIHGIIILNGDDVRGDVQLNMPTNTNKNYYSRISPLKQSLSVVIRTYKGSVKKWCNESGCSEFKWQSSFYEHIIRNEADLRRIRNYIKYNPLKWYDDDYYS
jgi:REP-associated tyrosine transposase